MSKIMIPVYVQAEDQSEANEISQHLNKLLEHLSKSDLIKFSQAVSKNPKLISNALKFI